VIAAFIDGYGQNQVLRVGDFPEPKPRPSDIVVRVHAASVNPVDFKLRDGKFRLLRHYRFPLILGHDCAGEVVQAGEKVTQFKIGDRIFSRPRNGRIGAFAEFIAIDQSEAALVPPNLNYHEAASLPLVALTSWQALVDTAQLEPRQKILIHAGSGGVGTFAIQLAKHIGAEVWTTTSGENMEFVKSLGADHVINYQNQDFERWVNNLDVVFDTLGGSALNKSFSITRPHGRVVSISGPPDHRTAKEMNLDVVRTLLLGIAGLRVNWKARKSEVNYRFIFMKPSGEALAQIADLVAKGVIKPVVDRIFPISECQSAIEYSASGKARGKIIINVID
jgi:NADPH:quinone reductase and related Zn-dependent oxidoreductases